MELEACEGECLSGCLGEPEWERHVHESLLARESDELVHVGALADHLGDVLLLREFVPHVAELGGEGVDGASSDDDGCALDDELADAVGPRCPHWRHVFEWLVAEVGLDAAVLFLEPPGLSLLEHARDVVGLDAGGCGVAPRAVVGVDLGVGAVHHAVGAAGEAGAHGAVGVVLVHDGVDAGELDEHVHEVDEVTRTIERDLRGLSELHLRVEGLYHALHRERGGFVVLTLPEGGLRALVEVLVHGALGDDLDDRSRGGVAYAGIDSVHDSLCCLYRVKIISGDGTTTFAFV